MSDIKQETSQGQSGGKAYEAGEGQLSEKIEQMTDRLLEGWEITEDDFEDTQDLAALSAQISGELAAGAAVQSVLTEDTDMSLVPEEPSVRELGGKDYVGQAAHSQSEKHGQGTGHGQSVKHNRSKRSGHSSRKHHNSRHSANGSRGGGASAKNVPAAEKRMH